jgi:hypothetical protein
MRVASTAVILVSVFATPSLPQAGQSTGPRQVDDRNASQTVQVYCAGCHNGVMRSPSGVVLDTFDSTSIAKNPDTWTRAYRQVQAGTMPPVGAPRPDRAAVASLLSSIEARLGASKPSPTDTTNDQIAQRLAALLWNSVPDAALLSDAQHGRLTQSVALDRQIQRMLADERADAFVSRFFFPWLGLVQLGKSEPDPKYFPGYTATPWRCVTPWPRKRISLFVASCARTRILSISGPRTTRF